MSGNSNQKAINLLNQIQYKTGISDCEKNALIQVFDPYADFEHKVVGWPSLQETKSNVTKNDYTMTIAAPDTEGGNWDCAIFMPKQTNVTSKLTPAGIASGCLFNGSQATTGEFGGCVALKKPSASGTPLNMTSWAITNGLVESIGPAISIDGSDPGSDDIQKVHRVIAKAAEVRLDANALSNQGSLVVWSQPETGIQDRTNLDDIRCAASYVEPLTSDRWIGNVDVILGDDIPGTPAAALLIPGSKQWLAKEGTMLVGKLGNWDIKPQTMMSRKVFFRESRTPFALTATGTPGSVTFVEGDFGVVTASNEIFNFAIGEGIAPGAASKEIIDQVTIDDFNCSGVLFTGLDPSATLVVNFVVYIESFPDSQSGSLIRLAQPTEPYSPMFPQMVSHLMRHMPAGCRINENKSGDWFFEGMQWLAKAIQPALALGGPVGKTLSVAAGAVNTWAGTKLKERAEARKEEALLAEGWIPMPRKPTRFVNPSANVPGRLRVGEFVNEGQVVVSKAPTLDQIRARNKAVRPPGQGQSRRAVRRRTLQNPPMTPVRAEQKKRAANKRIPDFYK